MKKKILFYSSVANKELFFVQQFYVVDINILKDLGYEIILSNSIAEAFRFWKYDFVFGYFYKYALFVAIIARFFGRKTYFTGGIDALDRSLVSFKEHWLQRIFVFMCNIVGEKCIIVSKTDMENVRRSVLFKNKLSYSEHTIDVGKFVGDVEKEHYFSTIAWQGTVANVQRKGVHLALILFSKLINEPEYKDYKFYIIGKKGGGTEFIMDMIKELGIEDYVILTDSISEEDKVNYLKKSKYYFQLSKYEGFGLAALEALCSNNIIIHSGKGGLANPIYKKCIKLNIDHEIENEYQILLDSLKHFNYNEFEKSVGEIKEYYSNERRKNDFVKILGYAG